MTPVTPTTHEPNTDRVNISIDTSLIGYGTTLTKEFPFYGPKFTFTPLYVQMIVLVHNHLLKPTIHMRPFKYQYSRRN
jgi:hypothetical protein